MCVCVHVCDFIIFWFVVWLKFSLDWLARNTRHLHTFWYSIIRFHFFTFSIYFLWHWFEKYALCGNKIRQWWTMQKIFTPFATCLDIWTLWCVCAVVVHFPFIPFILSYFHFPLSTYSILLKCYLFVMHPIKMRTIWMMVMKRCLCFQAIGIWYSTLPFFSKSLSAPLTFSRFQYTSILVTLTCSKWSVHWTNNWIINSMVHPKLINKYAGIESKLFHSIKAVYITHRTHIFMTNLELILTNPYRPHIENAHLFYFLLCCHL